MKYGDYWVSYCTDHGIERFDETTGKKEICDGYFCEVFNDPEYENRVDYFCLAVGHEIADTSDEELDKGIREYLGCPLSEESAEGLTPQM